MARGRRAGEAGGRAGPALGRTDQLSFILHPTNVLKIGGAVLILLGLANLENPADNVLHLVVGIWTAASALTYRGMAMAEARA